MVKRTALISSLCFVLLAQQPVIRQGSVPLSLINGPGIVLVTTSGVITLAVDTASVPFYLTTLIPIPIDFPIIVDGTCNSQTLQFTGIKLENAVVPKWPLLPLGIFGMMLPKAVGQLEIRLCNLSGVAIDLPSTGFGFTLLTVG